MAKRKKAAEERIEIPPDVKISFQSKNSEQKNMLKVISDNTISFIRGPAGCGKSYVSIAYALQNLFQQKYNKIILVRPIVQALGEDLGFLPGQLLEKISNYFVTPISIMSELMGPLLLKSLMNHNEINAKIQISPLAYMRGVTLTNSILLFDEAQNSTIQQMRLLLTRIGENSKFIVCGDTEQSDIMPRKNGLENAFQILQEIEGIGFVTMTEESIVRHPLIQKIEQRYNEEVKKHIKRKTIDGN